MKLHKTHGKKGKKRLAKQLQASQQHQHQQAMEMADVEETQPGDDGPLVRPGEGIVVDWNEEAWEDIYGGKSTSDGRGMPTFYDLQIFIDPVIERRRQQRHMRKKNGISLDDCLAEFEKEEILSEQDTWYCPRCKEHRRASKKFDLWKTPDILVVHLKRFSSAGWRREKLDILVDFPVQGLDLTQRVIDKEDGKEEMYDLIAVDDHWGGLGGGHYTAFAKNFVDGEWYEYNGKSLLFTTG
jgi:ubiquitin carboxyl-terminal hydrolase 4/11/15